MSSIMRLSGIASGMDTETMINQLMDAEKVKLNKFNASKQIKLWTQEAYNNTNKDIANFILDTKKDLELTKTTSTGILVSGSTTNFSWLKKATSSDTDIATVTSTSSAVSGSHSINVKQMAKGVSLASTESVSNTITGTGQTVKFNIKYSDSTTKEVSVVWNAGESISDLAKTINTKTSEANGTATPLNKLVATYDSTAERFFISTAKQGTDATVEVLEDTDNVLNGVLKLGISNTKQTIAAADSITSGVLEDDTMEDLLTGYDWAANGNEYLFTINNKEVSLSKTDTISSLKDKINGLNIADLTVEYDGTGDKLFKINAGASNVELTILGDSSKLLTSKLGLNLKENYMQGQKAIIDFDGAQNIEYSSNNITINGLNISIKSTGAVNAQVDTDVDGAYNKIKSFVDKYNELIDKLNEKISEKKYRDYTPLTDEQKEAMDEDTIKLWEGKAKSGLLRSDDNVNRILNNTRNGLYESVYDTYSATSTNTGKISGYSMLTEIGITTGTYQEKGKLKIDETALRTALGDNPDGVMNLLFKTSDITEADINSMPTSTESERAAKTAKMEQRRKESGVISRIYDDFVGGMKDIISKSGTGENTTLYRNVKSTILIDFVTKNGSISLLDNDVLSLEKQISAENDKLSRKETAYYKKFTAFEVAMEKMNSQSSWLSSQLGSM